MRRLPTLPEVIEATGLSEQEIKRMFHEVNMNGEICYCGDELYRLAAHIAAIRRSGVNYE